MDNRSNSEETGWHQTSRIHNHHQVEWGDPAFGVALPRHETAVMVDSTNGQNNGLITKTASASVLVIDDNFAIRNALIDILSLLPYMTVYTAANGYEGLQIVQEQPIALIVLDMNMPVMNGQQTYERLQQIAPQIKVIVSSSLSQAEARLRFGEQKLPTFLQKPYDLDTLLNVVQAELALA